MDKRKLKWWKRKQKLKRLAWLIVSPFVILYIFILIWIWGDPQERWEADS